MEGQNFNRAPQSERLHIALFGRRNAGKSSLINALTGQQIALVSDVPGTTTDPVIKSMEILPLGPCVLIDTAGFDDSGKVGDLRTRRTHQVINQADMAILVIDGMPSDLDMEWATLLKRANVPFATVVNKMDLNGPFSPALLNQIAKQLGSEVVNVSALKGTGLDQLRNTLVKLSPEDGKSSLTGNLAKAGDAVLLVMPQDPQAPKGRLILPQVQTLRDLMDKRCIAICCTTEDIDSTLASLQAPPHLIITDSQVFDIVEKKKPAKSLLTSFSVLMAAHKGDINYFVHSAAAIDHLTEKSRILIAEACTHAPLAEDIGREKIPRMLRQRVDKKLQEETGLRWSVLQTPAESTAYRFATLDKKQFGDQAIVQGEGNANYYTNSSHVPVDTGASLIEKIKIEEQYHSLTPGGHIFHAFMGESYSDPDSLMSLTDKIARKSDIGFWAYSSALSFCLKCKTLMKGLNTTCPTCGESEDVEWYDRITGYVQQVGRAKSASGGWNPGKRQELIDRRRFEDN